MNEQAHISILRRMAGQAGDDAPVSPISTSRAVRLALIKAGSDSCGLVLDVASTGEEHGSLDDVLTQFDDGSLLVGLRRQDRLAGVIALDLQLRAAVLEMQIMGRVLDQRAADRAATGTDKVLCEPMLAQFIAALPAAMAGTDDMGWVADLSLADRINDRRAAGLALADGDYRVLQMQIHLGAVDRQGCLLVVLPVVTPVAVAHPPAPPPQADWTTAFGAAVQGSRAVLTARIALCTMTLQQAQGMQPGDVIALPDGSITAVQLIAPDGRCVSQGKLGQMTGKRAVRVTAAPDARLDDLPAALPLPMGTGRPDIALPDLPLAVVTPPPLS